MKLKTTILIIASSLLMLAQVIKAEPILSGYLRGAFLQAGKIDNLHLQNVNDLIYFKAEPFANGDLYFEYPDNTAVASNVKLLKRFRKHKDGILQFNGDGAKLTAGKDLLLNGPGKGVKQFSFETWIYISDWQENAFIFNKSNDDSHKVSLQLGSKDKQNLLFQVVNGNKSLTLSTSSFKTRKWQHLALSYDANKPIAEQVKIYVNSKYISKQTIIDDTLQPPTSVPAMSNLFVIGENFDGKLDEIRLWHSVRSPWQIAKNMKQEIFVDTWDETKLKAYWKIKPSSRFVLDYQSWKADIATIKYFIKGHGQKAVRLGVGKGQWREMISNQAARVNFANNLKRVLLENNIDGVEFDFEWCENNDVACWDDYSKTIKTVTDILPEQLIVSASLHPIFYKIDKSAIKALDFVSIQAYGPRPVRFPYKEFTDNVSSMLEYGFPAEKLVMGVPFYAVKTDGEKLNNKFVTLGYQELFKQHREIDPLVDQISMVHPKLGKTNFTYNGQTTLIKKSQYVLDNKLRGVMIWSLGTDTDYKNPTSLLKAINEVIPGNTPFNTN
ncbi:glycosyl hydrolase family 18 protein [Thalassotalea sp. ND16A]|uniref:glycosyl hydrolase family 18 protein n=1 Tax=Thalassotalea sp. ND16A TaxID=1535422 RepID=UPI00051DD3E6|nr:glycosyl hydrolase family 18 protein [Thalassotalea sp. ND16A]KGK00114.1 hypothetical protein ND16A_0305 [Thalassotalea sp. ND16A]